MSAIPNRVCFRPGNADHIPDCFLANIALGQPTLVAIHGISRNAAEIASRFAAHPAFANVNIVAPLFERRRFGKYQQILPATRTQVRSDQALFDLLAALGAEYGILPDPFMLFGFSGGAQMAHRLAMMYPARVDRACAASAGWYLLPEPGLAYPYGMGHDDRFLPATDAFLDVHVSVIAGTRDTRIDSSVRQHPKINERQGANRLQRARIWVGAMVECAQAAGRSSRVTLTLIDGVSHDFSQCVRDGALIDVVAESLLPGQLPVHATQSSTATET